MCASVHVCKLQRHHLWPPFSAQQVAQTHMWEACAHISIGVLVGVCVCVFVESGGSIQQHTAAPLMNTLIMLKSAPCLGFPVPPGKVNSGWLHSTARACGCRGGTRRGRTQRLWRSALTVLDVSGPKIDAGMQSKYHGNIKAPPWRPRDKQTRQPEPPKPERRT